MFPTLQQLAELSAISFSIEPRHLPIHLQCSSTLDTLSKYELHFANPIKIYVGQESTISPVAYGIGYVIRINPFHPIRPYMASMQPLPIMMAIFLGYLWTVSHIFNM